MSVLHIKTFYFNNNYDEKIEYRKIYYDKTTLLSDVLSQLPNGNLQINDNFSLNNGSRCLSYLMVNGKIQWLVPIEECRVVDYLNTFCIENKTIVFYQSSGLGAVDIVEVLSWVFKIKDVVEKKSLIKDINSIFDKYIKWSYKNLLKDIGEVSFEDFEKAICYSESYSMADFCFRFNIDQDIAVIFLAFFGYVYFSDIDIYLFVPALYKKNKEKLLNV